MFGSELGILAAACRCFESDGLWGAWPDSELGSQRSDVFLAEPVAEELLVGNVVELLPCISEVLCGQAGIEAAGEADQLRRAVAVQHPGDIGVVAWFDTAR